MKCWVHRCGIAIAIAGFATAGANIVEAQPPTYVTQWGSLGSGIGQFGFTYGVATDAAGNVYASDNTNARIAKFTSSGVYLTQWGSEGAANGQFYAPMGVATDVDGNVYVADTGNHRIQKFTNQGVYLAQWGSQGAGNGQLSAPYGVATDASGNVFVADTGNNRVQKFSSTGVYLAQWGGVGLPFYGVWGVATDVVGNVYVVDNGHNRIQKFTNSGIYITGWGSYGSATGQFRYPNAVATDDSGNVYVSDNNNARIQKFSSAGGYLTQWGSYGAGNGQFDGPWGVAINTLGDIYVADCQNYRIQKFATKMVHVDSPNGTESWVSSDVDTVRWTLSTGFTPSSLLVELSIDGAQTWQSLYAGSNAEGRTPCVVPALSSTQALIRITATDSQSRAYSDVSDAPFNVILGLSLAPTPAYRWGAAGTAVDQLQAPAGLAIDSHENVYVADTGNHRVVVSSFRGIPRMVIGSFGVSPGHLSSPKGVCASQDGSILVSDTGNNRIQRFSPTGTLVDLWGQPGASAGQFNHPAGIAQDSNGNVYVADRDNHRIQKFDAFGQYLASWGSAEAGPLQLVTPTSVATSGLSRVYVTDESANRVKAFNASGALISSWVVDQPRGISTDSEGNVFVVNGASRRVLRFTQQGVLDTRWGDIGMALGQFQEPIGVGVHGGGPAYSAYVLDRSQPSVQRFVRYAVSGVGGEAPTYPGMLSLVPLQNPSSGPLTLRVTGLDSTTALAPGLQLTLVVTDVAGAVVSRRGFHQAEQGLGSEVVWDGKGPSGRPVAPGVYFVTLSAGAKQRTVAKVVRVR